VWRNISRNIRETNIVKNIKLVDYVTNIIATNIVYIVRVLLLFFITLHANVTYCLW